MIKEVNLEPIYRLNQHWIYHHTILLVLAFQNLRLSRYINLDRIDFKFIDPIDINLTPQQP